jgi:hypothetical protein
MFRLCNRIIFNVRKLKNIEPEAWVQKPQDASAKWADADLNHLNIKYFKDIKYEANAKKKNGGNDTEST